MLLLVLVVVFLYACGEKQTFQVSEIGKPYTHVKLATVGDADGIVLDEENTRQCMALFDEIVFEQTQSGGNFTDKSYSLIFLDGDTPVDSMQISEDGKTVAYGGFFYQAKEENYNIESILDYFEKQKREEAEQEEATQTEAESEPETEEEPESVMTEEDGEESGPLEEYFTGEEFDGQFPEESRIIAIQGGASCAVDLDGDGNKEEILYEVQSCDGIQEEVLFAVYDITQENEAEYVSSWRDGEVFSFAELEAPCTSAYYLADLDSTDSYYEIVILDYGPSDDPVYHFIRLETGELVYLGEIPSDSLPVVKGDGTVIASGRLSILQTWNAPFTWVLENEELEHPEEEWYYPYVNATIQEKPKQVKPVTVYEEPNPESEKKIVEPSEETISFGTTDNKNWVQFFRSDGIAGWIYLKDGIFMEADGEEYSVWEVFEDLYCVG